MQASPQVMINLKQPYNSWQITPRNDSAMKANHKEINITQAFSGISTIQVYKINNFKYWFQNCVAKDMSLRNSLLLSKDAKETTLKGETWRDRTRRQS